MLNKAADVIDSGKVTRDLLDAVEPVVDAVLNRAEVKPVDLRAVQDALKAMDATAVEQKEAGQKELFDTTTDRRRKDQEVGVIRQSAEAFNKVPAVVQARAAADKAREEAKKIEGTNFKVAAPFSAYAIQDGNLITGQQQNSGAAAAELLVKLLNK
jgi:putative intracellular protease/amidase